MDNLTPHDKAKLQNILRYYTEYRKTHYDDTVGIEIENKQRQEQQEEISRQRQKMEDVKKTEQYVLLHNKKQNILRQIEMYEDLVYEIRNTYEEYKKYEDTLSDTEEVEVMCDKIEKWHGMIETIEHEQRDIMKENGVDTELLGSNVAGFNRSPV
jgi:hypothetical protein